MHETPHNGDQVEPISLGKYRCVLQYGARPTNEAAIALLDVLEKVVELLREVTPNQMGGTPDLFWPERGWEQWEQDAEEVLRGIR